MTKELRSELRAMRENPCSGDGAEEAVEEAAEEAAGDLPWDDKSRVLVTAR
jgi:hypothetical protein